MLTIDEARQFAKDRLTDLSDDIVLSNTPIHTGDYGWVFAYQSQKLVQSGDSRDALFGNAPLLVDKHTGVLVTLGTAEPVGIYVENYISYGSPHDSGSDCVELFGWRYGAQKISATREIKAHTSFGMARAKFSVDECLAGRPAKLQCNSALDAEHLVVALNRVGFLARQLGRSQAGATD